MRRLTFFLALALAGGCSDDNKGAARPDLSAPMQHDMAVGGDAGSSTGCDIVLQDCPSSTDKCVVTDTGTQMMPNLVSQCVPVKGANTAGQTCTRTAFGVDDDCVKGLECTLRGVATGALACRKLCHADSDCASGERCTDTGDGVDGLCVPECHAYGADCKGGLTCGAIFGDTASTGMDFIAVLTCRSVGTVPLGGNCSANGDSDCVAGAACNPFAQAQSDLVCIKLCDMSGAHACGLDVDGGVIDCQPLSDASNALDNGICNAFPSSGPP
jgi:hypothetical protein